MASGLLISGWATDSPDLPRMVMVLLIPLAGMASMIWFATLFRRGYRDQDARRKGSRFLLGLGDFLVHWVLWTLGPLERTLHRLGATPDQMNAGGLLFGLLSGACIAVGRLEAGGWAILLAGVCDVLDGRLARQLQRASRYGRFVDSTCDRFVETFAFLGCAVHFADRPGGPLVVAAGLGGSLLVSYARARGETVEAPGPGGLMQRAERLLLMSSGCLFDAPLSQALGWPEGSVLLAVLSAVAVGALGTAAHRTLSIARELRQPPGIDGQPLRRVAGQTGSGRGREIALDELRRAEADVMVR